MTTISTDKYIYPPRPSTSVPRTETDFFKNLGWIAQYKYNGSRCLIKHLPGSNIQLWNRHGERFRTYHAPDWLQEEIRQAIYKLGLSPDNYHVFDGELLDQKHSEIKDTIVIWDILVMDGEHLLDSTYMLRHDSLCKALSKEERWFYKSWDFGFRLSDHVLLPQSYAGSDWDYLWDVVSKVNAPFPDRPLLEGLMLKDPLGTLERGFREKNNGTWMVRSRVQTGRHNF